MLPPMLQTVRDVCKLQPEALSFRVSDGVEKIDELIRDEGDGHAFFARTHITHGMEVLLREGIERLAGKSNQAIFHLKQAMGGGKTHLLIGLGLLARHPKLRKQVCGDAKIPHAGAFDIARIAAFNGRDNPEHFLWGEIAAQLGRADKFKKFWTDGPKAPAESDWLALLDGADPTLILLDELPPYFHYLDTQKAGNTTAADIATRAFANLLSAAGKRKNVCIVVSDLAASYETGAGLIHRALGDARQELGRQERTITPVDLAGDEIYAILRKRLFAVLPSQDAIDEVATQFGQSLAEAGKAKVASRGAESIADEIASTYPFHPRLKNLVALFKENEKFKQTRGLMELVSLLLRSVWERKTNDVYLIGPQHFDIGIADVREKLASISEMRDAIAKDLWDASGSAHAQSIDANRKSDAASQVGSLLFTASMSTAVNAVKGLSREELVEALAMPHRKPSEFLEAYDALAEVAWYLHHTPEGKHYFDRQENLTKLLQSLAADAPESKIDELIQHRLRDMFKPIRKVAYTDVIALPEIDQIVEKVKKGRVLLIVSPESKLPPERVQKLFDNITEKNNLCVLTGDHTSLASVEAKARQVFAGEKADSRIPKGHPQREELDKKRQTYAHDLTTTIVSVFDKVLFPRMSGSKAALANKTLDGARDLTKAFDGEAQLERTLTSDPAKLVNDLDAKFGLAREKAESLLWPAGQTTAPWKDILMRAEEQAGFPWLPPKGLEQLRELACNRGVWEDLGNGHLSKAPQPKRTGVQVSNEDSPDDSGEVRLKVTALNGGPTPRVHYAEDGVATTASSVVQGTHLTTRALRVSFLVIDPTGTYPPGEPTTWTNQLVIRNEVVGTGKQRAVKLTVVPRGALRFTLDGRTSRDGDVYDKPIVIGAKAAQILVFAEADGLEATADFKFAEFGGKAQVIDPAKPATLAPNKSKKLDSREKTYSGLESAKAGGAVFTNVQLTLGQAPATVTFTIGEVEADAAYLEALVNAARAPLPADAPMTMTFKRVRFKTGHALEQFAAKVGLEIVDGEVQQ